jgi:hypothetical protein
MPGSQVLFELLSEVLLESAASCSIFRPKSDGRLKNGPWTLNRFGVVLGGTTLFAFPFLALL